MEMELSVSRSEGEIQTTTLPSAPDLEPPKENISTQNEKEEKKLSKHKCACGKLLHDYSKSITLHNYAFGSYICSTCIPKLLSEHMKIAENKTEYDSKMIEYIAGLMLCCGIWSEKYIVLIPCNKLQESLLTEISKDNCVLTPIRNHEKNSLIFVCHSFSIANEIGNIFGFTSENRIVTQCLYTFKNNITFYRALVDTTYDKKQKFVLEIPEIIYKTIPIPCSYRVPTSSDNIKSEGEGEYGYRYNYTNLQELVGTVLNDVLEYVAFEAFIKSTYGVATLDKAASQEELKDRDMLSVKKRDIPFIFHNSVAVYLGTYDPHIVQFIKTCDRAVIPVKANVTDSGYDLTLIEKVWQKGVYSMYDTGIIVIPSNNIASEIRARSSIYKTGYALANGVGTIDTSYRGTLRVIVYKVDPNAPDLELPAVITQLVLVNLYTTISLHTCNTIAQQTMRQDGGFGSSGK